jgi:uncharacterized membrane protein
MIFKKLNLKFYLFLILGILLFFIPNTLSYDNYADIVLEVDKQGIVEVSGITNLDILGNNFVEYTSKLGKYWILNYSLEHDFSDYVVEVILPNNVEINYIKIPSLNRIVSGEQMKVITSGKDSKIKILIQYSFLLEEKEELKFYNDINIISLVGVLLIMLLITFLIRNKIKKNKKIKKIDMSRLTDRQKKILNFVLKERNEITQSKLEKLTGFPKASLSRNISALERFNLIEKKEYGMTNLIRLKENN